MRGVNTTEALDCAGQSTTEGLDKQIVQLVFELAKRFSTYFEAQVAEMDLTGPQAFLLRSLDTSRPMNQLADKLRCDASNLTGIVDRLEGRGLVERGSLARAADASAA